MTHGADKYLFSSTPFPVQATERLTRVEKDVWGAVYTWHRLKRSNLTVKRVAELSGMSGRRYNVNRALESLEGKGMIRRRRKRERGMHLVDIVPLWPDWIEAEGLRSPEMIAKKRAEVGAQGEPRGGAQGEPRGGAQGEPPYKSTEKSRSQESERAVASDRPGHTPEEPGEVYTEVEEINPDGGSREAAAHLSSEKEERRTRREKKLKRERPPSGPEFSARPSERWEWNRHRGRKKRDWSGRDLVGYWVCRFRELRGAEDEEFFCRDLKANFPLRTQRNAGTFVRKHLRGDWEAAAQAVDRILERAEERGLPVAFAYFFTPRSGEAVEKILKRGRGRAPSPQERNDARGDDREFWRRRAEEQLRQREAENG